MPAPSSAHPHTWTAGTVVLLVVCVLISAGAVTAAAVLPGYARDAARRDAESTLRAFLDDAIANDAGWTDEAGALLESTVPLGAPLVGDPATAEAIELSAQYEIERLRFFGDSLANSDSANATVTVRYSYTLLGERGTASIPQNVWLTRPFYYGDEVPQQADPTASPTAIGPWQVVGISVPSKDDLGGDAPTSRCDLTSEERPGDSISCHSPVSALVEVADNARIDGRLASGSFLGAQDGSDVIDPALDTSALLEAFPAVDAADTASIRPELTRVDEDLFRGLRAPFTQYLIADRYAVTFAAVTTEDGDDAVRLVSIREAEGER